MLEHKVKMTKDGEEVGELKARRMPLRYPGMTWRGDPAVGMDAQGRIYVALRMRVFCSCDGGQSWSANEVRLPGVLSEALDCYDSFGVLRDGTLLWAYSEEGNEYILRSGDGGKSWEKWGEIEDKSPYGYSGGGQNCITELPDGAIVWPVTLHPAIGEPRERLSAHAWERKRWEGLPSMTTYTYRSTDGGRTWPERAKLEEWGCETSILALKSGRLLAVIRYQRHRYAPPPDNEPPELAEIAAKATDGDAQWPGKRVFFADSDDAGRSWHNFRPLVRQKGGKIDLENGEAHGHAIQLADGRVLVAHEHRYPYDIGDIRARVSHDEGQTWTPEVYHLSQGHGYAGSVQLDDGTILTVCGNTLLTPAGEPTTLWQAQVVFWRLPDGA